MDAADPTRSELRDLSLACAFMEEAVHRLHHLLRDQPEPLTLAWQADYQEAWRYFERARKRYQRKAASLDKRDALAVRDGTPPTTSSPP
jgi:hypothetical protein